MLILLHSNNYNANIAYKIETKSKIVTSPQGHSIP